jgi:hypothetical protein
MPSESVLDAHAVASVQETPLIPLMMLMFPAPSFGMSIGIESGGMRSLPASTYFRIEFSMTSKPPMPLPITMPEFA